MTITMLSILENSSLKETDCDMQASSSQNIPTTAELYSDEMTRSVPSIRTQSSQEFVTFNTGRRNSRKGRPNRSCSWQDAAPGIVFKFNDDSQTILVIPNNISSCEFKKLNLLNQFDESEKKKVRSRSITNLSGFLPFSSRCRPRSFSVDCSSIASFSHDAIQKNSTNSVVDEVDEDEFSLDTNRESRKSTSNAAISQKKKINSSVSSLSHLVPNKLLSSLSRRVSASSSHDLCRCSSCSQSVTPYWRDGWAEDVMLCNACGLRFQKFAQRCMYCKYIPRKEDGVEHTCPQCQAPWEC
jgi:hypothetical protein